MQAMKKEKNRTNEMNYVVINLEEGRPTANEAMDYLKMALLRYKREKAQCMVVIHGYGSSGKGGVIREKARSYLTAQKRNRVVKNVIYGEDFEMFNFEAIEIKNKYKIPNDYYGGHNHGVTIVEL